MLSCLVTVFPVAIVVFLFKNSADVAPPTDDNNDDVNNVDNDNNDDNSNNGGGGGGGGGGKGRIIQTPQEFVSSRRSQVAPAPVKVRMRPSLVQSIAEPLREGAGARGTLVATAGGGSGGKGGTGAGEGGARGGKGGSGGAGGGGNAAGVLTTGAGGAVPGEVEEEVAPKRFPWWMRYLVWAATLSYCVFATYTLLLFSFEWGWRLSLAWLYAFVTSLFFSLFIVDPVLIVGLACVITFFSRDIDDDDTTDAPQVHTVGALARTRRRLGFIAGKWRRNGRKRIMSGRAVEGAGGDGAGGGAAFRLSPSHREALRQHHKKQAQMFTIVMQLAEHVLLVLLVGLVLYTSSKTATFDLVETAKATLLGADKAAYPESYADAGGSMFASVNTQEDFWEWAAQAMPASVPTRPRLARRTRGRRCVRRVVPFGEKLTGGVVLVGPARMRQLRVGSTRCGVGSHGGKLYTHDRSTCVPAWSQGANDVADFAASTWGANSTNSTGSTGSTGAGAGNGTGTGVGAAGSAAGSVAGGTAAPQQSAAGYWVYAGARGAGARVMAHYTGGALLDNGGFMQTLPMHSHATAAHIQGTQSTV